MMVGLAGSGKSTWIRNHMHDYDSLVSRDTVRFFLVKENEEYFSRENEVFEQFIKNIQTCLTSGDWDIYVDATHLNEKARNKVLDRLNLENVEVIPIAYWASVDTCLERNSQRVDRAKVPEDVIINMCKDYQKPTFLEKYKILTI